MHMVLYLKNLFETKFKQKPSDELQLRFLEHLYRNLIVGYSMLESLEKIQWDKQLKNISKQIITVLKGGKSLDVAFKKLSFHEHIVISFYFFKEHGEIFKTLENSIQETKNRIAHKRKFKQAIRYPIVLFLMVMILLSFLRQLLVPLYTSLLTMNPDESNFTTFLLKTVDHFILIVIFGVLVLLLFLYFYKHYQQKIDCSLQIAVIRKIPIYRKIFQTKITFDFTNALSNFLHAGLSIHRAFEKMKNQNNLLFLAYFSTKIYEQLEQGRSLTAILVTIDPFRDELIDIFHQSHDHKTLAKDLSTYAHVLAEEMNRKIKSFLNVLQPICFSLIALFIILLYAVLMFPMIQWMNQL